MPGNENEIIKCLMLNKGFTLKHLGEIVSIGAPQNKCDKKFCEIESVDDIDSAISTQDSRKKADVYINGFGVSLKQSGASFSYNRIQRANLKALLENLEFIDVGRTLGSIDRAVTQFHRQELDGRNRPWEEFFTEKEFEKLLRFLMMEGSPNVGMSSHPAEFILEAPRGEIQIEDVGRIPRLPVQRKGSVLRAV